MSKSTSKWQLKFFFHTRCSQGALACNGCASTCETFLSAIGNFSHGSGLYPNGANCQWIIAPVGVTGVTIRFTSFSTERCCDFVKVYQCSSLACRSKEFLSELSGTYPIAQNITSTTGYVLVHFTTNANTQYPGFIASWTSSVFSPNVSLMHSSNQYHCQTVLWFSG